MYPSLKIILNGHLFPQGFFIYDLFFSLIYDDFIKDLLKNYRVKPHF